MVQEKVENLTGGAPVGPSSQNDNEVTSGRKNQSILKILSNKGFLLMFASFILLMLGSRFVNVGLLVHATEDLFLDQVVIGTVLGTFSLFSMITRPFAAIFSDRINRKRILIVAVSIVTISTAGFGFAVDYAQMYFCMFLKGVGCALFICASGVMIADIIGRQDLGFASGVFLLGPTIGESIASAICLALADAVGFTITFIVGAVINVVGIICACLIPYKQQKRKDLEGETVWQKIKGIRIHDFITKECIPIGMLQFIIQMLSFMVGVSFLVMFGRIDLGIANLGIAVTISGIIQYFTRPVFGRIMDKYGARWCVYPCLFGFIAVGLIYYFAQDFITVLIGSVVYGVVCGGFSLPGKVLALKRADPNHMSAGTQTNGILSDFGQTIGNMIVPFIAVTIGGGFYRPTYLFVVGIAVIGILYAFIYSKLYLKRHPNNEIGW